MGDKRNLSKFNSIYFGLLYKLWHSSIISKPRNLEIKELIAVNFSIDASDNIIDIKNFETNTEYAQEELRWYLSGSNHITFSDKIYNIWKRYSDDGITVNSAYGYRIFDKNIYTLLSQWEWVKKKLKRDIHSRQAVININLPADKLNETKDFPCTMYLQILVRDNKLNWITNMRSQDIYYGMRNDIYCFTELQKILAKQLNLSLGRYYHFCGSLHLYEKQYDKVKQLMKNGNI